MLTEEQRGYQDAIRQVLRVMEHRLHHLQEQTSNKTDESDPVCAQIREIKHLIQIIESLHR